MLASRWMNCIGASDRQEHAAAEADFVLGNNG